MAVDTKASSSLAVRQQGHYSGGVTRFAAYVIDQFVLSTVFGVTVLVVSYAVQLVTHGVEAPEPPVWLLAGLYSIWWLTYFAYPWAVSGRTFGMGLLGIRVVARDGNRLSARRSFIRALALPLSFLTLGIGFLGILVGRERRALHDVLAGSAVVYAWDARAAQLRFLAGDHSSTAG
jgi:uncharacterized RDD family membrane protein YckC